MSIEEEPEQFKLIEEFGATFLGTDADGHSLIHNRTNYNVVKLLQHKGKRIEHKFQESRYITETFNDGIFNCCMDDQRIQIADAESIAKIVNNNDESAYVAIFRKWYSIKMQKDIVNAMLAPYDDRIKTWENMFIVDGIFAVDDKAQAYVMDDGKWNCVCLVSPINMGGTSDIPGLGVVDVNDLTMLIIAKIMFLLNPNLSDKGFLNQITEKAQKFLQGK